MLKPLIMAIGITAMSAHAALAGGLAPQATSPAHPSATGLGPHDWSGAYAGIGFGTTSAEGRDGTNSERYNDGRVIAGFAGYQWQLGRIVLGAEVAYGAISDAYLARPGGYDDDLSHALDAKARVGYAVQRLLVYGVAGYSTSRFTVRHPLDIGTYHWDLSGLSYGVGTDYAINDRFAVGIEYLRRELSGDETTGAYDPVDVDLDTISIRAVYRF